MSTKFVPHEYQQNAIQWGLDHEKCGLLLPMGAGKTIITLSIIQKLLFTEVSNVLIIGPKRVVESTWPAEIRKWAHTDWMTTELITPAKAKGRERIVPANIYLSTGEHLFNRKRKHRRSGRHTGQKLVVRYGRY